VPRTVRPTTPADTQRKAIARDEITNLRRLDAAVKELGQQPKVAAAAS
jgi:hypothetical protein